LKLLVVSHACVTPINQSFYADLARLTGWEIELVIPSSWDTEYTPGLRVSRWPDFHGPIHAINVWKRGNIPLHLYRNSFVSLLRKVRPDVIYMHHESYGAATAQVYAANLLAGKAPIGFYAAQNILKNYPIPFRWLERWVLKHSAFCFPVSEGAHAVLQRKGYKGLAEVLPLAIDQNVYHPQPEWAAAKRAELGIGSEEFVLGYLGRLVEEKGLLAMLHATKALAGKRWRCVFVGSGQQEQELCDTATQLGIADRVHFVGFVPHVEAPGWLSLFDVLILDSETRPNWKEQFGRVIVEANACETAVIGTESGEIGNVLRDTGGGLIVPEGDVAALGNAMLTLANDPDLRQRLALAGATTARLKYDQNVLASRFAETITKAYERKGKNQL
jgi:glycosyltransferase involved in cell wall biosynthesis